ncbi:MAG: cupin domain-containing protein [Gemmatimonadota bacterium]
MRSLLLAPAMLFVCATSLNAQANTSTTTAMKRDTLHWGPAPAVFPRGAQMAVVSGDPSKSGTFRIQLRMPDGYRIPPHFHPSDENIEVKQGTFLVGMGDVFNATSAKAMNPGEHGTVPANGHHFGQAKGEVVVEVTAVGPFAMTYVNPADDPSKAHP